MWFAVFDGSPQAYQDIADNIATPIHSHSMYVRRYFCARLHTSMEVMHGVTNTCVLDTVPDVQFIQAPFTSVLASDELLNGVGAVVCLPPSSLSAVSHPVDFVLQEGGAFDAKMTRVYM